MFLCVSPNPAIDKRIELPSLTPREIHRARTVRSFPGGKSAHVAMVLKTLGAEPHWIGMCGGATGDQLVSGLRSLGIAPHAVSVRGETRTNLEIVDDAGGVTEIREPGEPVTPSGVETFVRECGALFAKAGRSSTIIFSGSLPPGAPADLYARLLASARAAGCRTLLDTSGEPLRLALASHPDLVKPNREEAASLLNVSIDSTEAAAEAARKLIAMGARSVALSLGAVGMLYLQSEKSPLLFAPAVSVRARSTVGCGDAALAGFAFSFAAGVAGAEGLCMAAACAAANCLADSPGAARLEKISEFRAQVRVEAFAAAG